VYVPSTPSVPTVVPSPSPIPIPVPPQSGCPTGQYRTDGTCVWDTVTVPKSVPDTCPSGFYPDGYGNCLPSSNPATSLSPSVPVTTCASGYHSDG